MNMNRREVLKASGGTTVMALMISAGLLKAGDAAAQEWNKNAFETKNLNDTVKALGGTAATESKDITFVNAPDIAENGAVVPVGVQSKIPKTEMIAILVEKNPNSLSASFMIPEGTEATVSTRVKMGQTSNVHAVVKADGKFYYATKEIKVTLGGCGG
ncbi:MAG: thiosulfate oxidation carrier protein SoxY [Rhodocyclaceae bacterium]|nr:thiosulfate oxidation carrier protein SoxY [Rhodocyclaceae bacterium]MCA3023725.1 thiosulfate oxidation carrier protein SoxY [Rhodocyclaceae bacterium]MCA3030380.1 thiosulfate oxidation carrier protein SoxY [Rhodocyclaceae bacterium]MCA3035712.1 thiosulfate oxidation carrier protein SoxY [Rhodocyclaceae bacterium]MCA3045616.1 thiosulfate oxidation carrier protein SoxY [Rhodocyclaceae bacterium]